MAFLMLELTSNQQMIVNKTAEYVKNAEDLSQAGHELIL